MARIRGTRYSWQLSTADDTKALEVAHRYSLSIPIARSVLARGYEQWDSIDRYLFGSWSNEVGDPALLWGASQTVDRLLQAIERQEKILVAGDYDVDGITASSLMMACLKPLGAFVNFFLPHRVKDGYGLSVATVERAAHSGYKVVITVDNGITAFEPAQRARELGIDLIITDHHQVQGVIPQAYAIVNPHQSQCAYPYKFFAGVGVIFKVLSLLYARLEKELPYKAYELLLLGTVADVVPLTGENRYWVRECLRHINKKESLALKVLKHYGRLAKEALTSKDVGFYIAPQINALGRLEDARQAVGFLLGSNEMEVSSTGQLLADLNQTRKGIEKSILDEIVARIDKKEIDVQKEKVIIASSDSWPPGVIGLVASRLVGLYHRPVILFHITSAGIAKGSCRSIPSFNMFEALSSCKDILKTFGGHAQAAGLSLSLDKISELKDRLELRAQELLVPEDFEPKLAVDSYALLSDFTKKFIDDIAYLEPFGHQNPEPVFWIRNVSLAQSPTLLKDAHVKAMIFSDGVIKPIIFFNRPDLFEWLEQQNNVFDVAVHVKENVWKDRRSIELTGIDASQSEVV